MLLYYFYEDVSKVVQSPEFGLWKDFFDVAQIKTVQFTLVIHELPKKKFKTAEDRLSGENLMITFNMCGNVQNLITILDNFDNISNIVKQDKCCLFPKFHK